MSILLIIFKSIVMGICMYCMYRLYQSAKLQYVIRIFFERLEQIDLMYEIYTISNKIKDVKEENDISLKTNITKEDVEYLLDYVQETISYCDENGLRDFGIEDLDEAYCKLLEVSTELRRWLWIN